MKRITEQPFTVIIDREWKRAKRILPVLKKKPKFVWLVGNGGYYNRSGCVGWCERRTNTIALYQGYKHLKDHKEFVLTLRHELAHLPKPKGSSHGADFNWWNTRLGGTRYAKYGRRTILKMGKRGDK
jgi:hypothetical protein